MCLSWLMAPEFAPQEPVHEGLGCSSSVVAGLLQRLRQCGRAVMPRPLMHARLFCRVLDLIKLLPLHRWGVPGVSGCRCFRPREGRHLPWQLARCIPSTAKANALLGST